MEKKIARLPATTNYGRASVTSSPTSTTQQHAFNRADSLRSKGFTSQYCYPSHNNGSARSCKGRGGGRSSAQRRPPRPASNHEVSHELENSAISLDGDKKLKHGRNANHLLNFSYAPLQSQEGGQRPSSSYRRPGKSRLPILTKEQFLQANCQFIVNSGLDYEFVEHLSHPDKMVPWELIEQIRVTDEQLATCPICLDVPVAAKMTKCSHIYCWPCMLHYLSLSDHAWARCPICFDAVEGKDLKSASVIAAPRISVGEKITLTLMKRERDSLYVRPRDSWLSTGSGKLHDVNAAEDDRIYSKILTATNNDIIDMLTEERRQLQGLINHNDTQSLEASFVQIALDDLVSRMEILKPAMVGAVTSDRTPTVASEADELNVTELSSAPKIKASSQLKTVAYLDAFSNEMAEEDSTELAASQQPPAYRGESHRSCDMGESQTSADMGESQTPADMGEPQTLVADTSESQTPADIGESQIPADMGDLQTLVADTSESQTPAEQGQSGELFVLEINQSVSAEISKEASDADTSPPTRAHNSSSTSSSDCADSELVAADLVLPPTGTQNPICERTKSKRTEVYYFYQASDGRNIYLHSLNTRILAAEYGSLELAPATLTATVVESEVNSISADLRKRLKYLSHLPLYSQFTVCEVALRPPIVSSTVLSHFSEELARRKKARSRRVRTENRQLNKAQAEERRKMGQYPAMKMALNSNQHFPTAVNFPDSDSLVSPADPPVSDSSSPSVADLQQHDPPLSTPLSFAQTMRGTAGSDTSWRRAHTSTSKPLALSDTTAATDDDETAAPTFRDSFCADFDRLLLNKCASGGTSAAAADSAATSATRGKGGKKKGKKQQLVLFSTSGQRTNN